MDAGDALRYIQGQRSHRLEGGGRDVLRYVTGQRSHKLMGAAAGDEGLGFGEDLEAAWNICKWCKKLGATIGGSARGKGASADVDDTVAMFFGRRHRGARVRSRPMPTSRSSAASQRRSRPRSAPTEWARLRAACRLTRAWTSTASAGPAMRMATSAPSRSRPRESRRPDHLGGYRSLAKDFKAKTRTDGEDEYVDDGLDAANDGLGAVVGDGVGAAPTTVTQWVPDASGKLVKQTGIAAPATPDGARRAAVIAYLQSKAKADPGTGETTFDPWDVIYDRLLKRGYLFALPGELIQEGVVVPAASLGPLLLRIPVQPQKGAVDLGDVRVWISGRDTSTGGVGGVDNIGGPTAERRLRAEAANGGSGDFILDVRTEGEFNGKHLQGAVNVPIDDSQRADSTRLSRRLAAGASSSSARAACAPRAPSTSSARTAPRTRAAATRMPRAGARPGARRPSPRRPRRARPRICSRPPPGSAVFPTTTTSAAWSSRGAPSTWKTGSASRVRW